MSQCSFQKLQLHQKEHDKRFHPDIYALSHPEQIRHFCFHFAKYTGRLAQEKTTHSLEQTLADIAIIALSAANVHNLDLDIDLVYVQESRAGITFLSEMAIQTGRMAKACESLDHMEYLDYRGSVRHVIATILAATTKAAAQANLDIKGLIVTRWHEIERKMIL